MRKKALLAAAVTAVLFLSAGCGASSGRESYAAMSNGSVSSSAGYDAIAKGENPAAAEISPEASLARDDGELYAEDSTASLMAQTASRKIILTASFDLETKEYGETLAAINTEVEQTGSYIQYSSASGSAENGDAHTSLTIRVPSDRYNAFKAFIPTLGNVTYTTEGGEDVTSEYFDADTRLKVLKAQEERTLELLAKAETVEDMLKIEEQLTRVRIQIEQLTSELKRYDDLVSYATVNLSVRQTQDYTPVKEETFLSRIGKAMEDSLRSLSTQLQNLVIALVWLVPYLVVLALVTGVVLLIVLLCRRNTKRRPGKTGPPDPFKPRNDGSGKAK